MVTEDSNISPRLYQRSRPGSGIASPRRKPLGSGQTWRQRGCWVWKGEPHYGYIQHIGDIISYIYIHVYIYMCIYICI